MKGLFLEKYLTILGKEVSVVGPRLTDGKYIIYDKLKVFGIIMNSVEEVVEYLEKN